MKTRNQYGTFENFLRDNESDLRAEYNNCEDERERLYENPSFEDFCMGSWQSLS